MTEKQNGANRKRRERQLIVDWRAELPEPLAELAIDIAIELRRLTADENPRSAT